MKINRRLVKYSVIQIQKAYSRCYINNNFSTYTIEGASESLSHKSLHHQAFKLKKDKSCVASGQPTPCTHPHILKYGEITSGITKEEYAERRFRLINLIQTSAQNSMDHIVVLLGSHRRYMIDKIPYLFRQNTDMLYMSGCLEPDCVLVLHTLPKESSTSSHKSVMFNKPYDPSKELWDGPRTAPSGATQIWCVDEGLSLLDLPKYLSSIERELNGPNIWYHSDDAANGEAHGLIENWLKKGRTGKIMSPTPFIHKLRSKKSTAEIELMRKTCQISAESIKDTMKICRVPISENELFATVDYLCRLKGAEHLAYPPVVAGGSRTNIIHYINNNNMVKNNEMILMDAGSEYRGYSGDVTRTWPVNGKFTPAQRDLYEAVLDVQMHVIKACSELPSLNQLFSIMCSRLGIVLQELCIIPKHLTGSELSRAAYGFCPHHVSHYLGMDVHDTPSLSRSSPLSPGSIITVEPGIYISEKNIAVDPRYLGLGIRIEDDILIGSNGKIEILSDACPSYPDQIEIIVGSNYNKS